MAKKVKELTTELQLRQGEYSSNLKEKEEQVQKYQITVHVKEDSLKQMGRKMEQQENELTKLRKEIEEANRTIRDLTNKFKDSSRLDQATIARKTKELETVLREKKCQNCILCVEDIKTKITD